MDYKKIYETLCSNCKARPLTRECGYEIHHIIPKLLGGKDSKENLVKLSIKEHVFAHRLLVKIYPDNLGLKSALFFMSQKARSSELKNFAPIHKYLKRRECIVEKSQTIRLHNILRNVKPYNKFLNTLEKDLKLNQSSRNPTTRGYYIAYMYLILSCKALGFTHIDGYKSGREGFRFSKLKDILVQKGLVCGDALLLTVEGRYGYSSFSRKYLAPSILTNAICRWNKNNPEKMLMVVGDEGKFSLQPVTYWADECDIRDLKLFQPFKDNNESLYKIRKMLKQSS